MPYIVAAVRSFGGRLWSKAEDAAVDDVAGWGSRLALRLRAEDSAGAGFVVVEAVDDVLADPENPDTHAALRVKVGKALTGSPRLLADIVDLLRQAQQATLAGDRSVAVTDPPVPPAGT
ncbi:hypothetical protein [Actinoplanes sp. NPDC049118]|uniref:hypothetical protein n=1 Tax=Actinoplanes sp. NPDC049118 TaxID=3155769 RepID=UPI0033DA5B80